VYTELAVFHGFGSNGSAAALRAFCPVAKCNPPTTRVCASPSPSLSLSLARAREERINRFGPTSLCTVIFVSVSQTEKNPTAPAHLLQPTTPIHSSLGAVVHFQLTGAAHSPHGTAPVRGAPQTNTAYNRFDFRKYTFLPRFSARKPFLTIRTRREFSQRFFFSRQI